MTRSLVDNFLSSAARYPARDALWAEGHAVSYEELGDAAGRIANTIVGNLPGARAAQCAVFAYRTVTAYAAVLGAQMAGMAYVPLNPKFPAQRNGYMLDLSKAETIVIDHRCLPVARDVLSAHDRPLLVILPDSEVLPEWADELPIHRFVTASGMETDGRCPGNGRPKTDDLAYIVFTSGSTGMPKGVAVTQGNAVSYSDNIIRRHQPGCDDRFIQLPDLTFDLSVHDLVVPWAVGACLYCVPEVELMVPDRFVRQHHLTYWTSVPSAAAFLHRFGKLKPRAFDSLRFSVFCGEPLPMSLARTWCEAAPNSLVDNLYGPTEATVAFTGHVVGPACPEAIVPIGEPFPDQEVAICDDDLNVLTGGEVGELLLGGSQVASGYWLNPELTRERFIHLEIPGKAASRWYRTGDLVGWQEGAGLIFRGRKDRQVKIRGHRVEIQEVEVVLRQVANTDLVAVFPWPDDSSGVADELIAFVQGDRIDPREIRSGCGDLLARHMIPKEIIGIGSMPLNSSHKVDYRTLKDMFSTMETQKNNGDSTDE